METRKIYKCFISSPGDCQIERESCQKVIDKIESNFTTRAKSNEKILIKIVDSPYYIKNGFTHSIFLEHECYDFETFHFIEYDEETDREIQFCYKHGIYLIDAEKKHFKIIKKEKNED